MELVNGNMTVTTDSNLHLTFTKIENFPIYEMTVKGNFPNKYVGTDLKNFFTTNPEKFSKVDCGDFGG